MRSNIIDNFLKISQENSISKKAPEKAKQKLEKNPRADSLSAEDIAKLYNIKPDLPKGNQYKRNIIENAHPKSTIVAPSYDKLNGLVENNNERQDIILNILNKNPNGHLTNHKYAEKELILSLVRIANDLDNSDNEKLRVLADACLFQISKISFKKEAIIPLAGAALIAIPILIGTLYLQQHISFINEGFEKNHQKLISEIDDLLQASSSWGVGYDYKSDFKNMLQDFRIKLITFYDLYKKIEPIITDLEKPRTAQDLIELSKQPQTDSVIKAYGMLRTAADNMLPYIMTIEKNFSSEAYKARQIEDKGFMSSLIDKVQFLHGGKSLVADDFDDVVRAISPYKKSISEIVDLLRKAESMEKAAQQQISEAAAESAKEYDEEKLSPPELKSTKKESDEDIESQIKELEKDLSGGLE